MLYIINVPLKCKSNNFLACFSHYPYKKKTISHTSVKILSSTQSLKWFKAVNLKKYPVLKDCWLMGKRVTQAETLWPPGRYYHKVLHCRGNPFFVQGNYNILEVDYIWLGLNWYIVKVRTRKVDQIKRQDNSRGWIFCLCQLHYIYECFPVPWETRAVWMVGVFCEWRDRGGSGDGTRCHTLPPDPLFKGFELVVGDYQAFVKRILSLS